MLWTEQTAEAALSAGTATRREIALESTGGANIYGYVPEPDDALMADIRFVVDGFPEEHGMRKCLQDVLASRPDDPDSFELWPYRPYLLHIFYRWPYPSNMYHELCAFAGWVMQDARYRDINAEASRVYRERREQARAAIAKARGEA